YGWPGGRRDSRAGAEGPCAPPGSLSALASDAGGTATRIAARTRPARGAAGARSRPHAPGARLLTPVASRDARTARQSMRRPVHSLVTATIPADNTKLHLQGNLWFMNEQRNHQAEESVLGGWA